ncbi:MAG: L-histidine N(alpha)-methyltransferase [Alphaproteobacteria bacterium]|nr:L-histidine N(alpha)-methyltransferase [Alphaproteobacteria bacterium]
MSEALRAVQPADMPEENTSEFAADVVGGLSGQPKRLSSKYFYDERGSLLFERICSLPEYYPTRTEVALLRTHAAEIACFMGSDALLVEFGAGALVKVDLILDAIAKPRAYVPVDISGDYLYARAARLLDRHPGLSVWPVVGDFTLPIKLPGSGRYRRAGFFPGSTIGNLEPPQAAGFLRNAAELLRGGGLLVGVDLVKDSVVLHAAYNDSAGVTEAFNKNLLVRANRELGANFHLPDFRHHAFYDPTHRRIEMHLVAGRSHTVSVMGRRIVFTEGETIHTENSYKYTVQGFVELAREAGCIVRRTWCDPQNLFSLHWLEC